jgi:glycosyltransferase involved in cell wall biosynthesis
MPNAQEYNTPGKCAQYNDRIWISWEHQRRTITLSHEFNAKLFIVKNKRVGLFRYPELIIKTVKIIFQEKPKYVFAQNPSIILAALICFLKKHYKYTAIIDRHTNFKLNHRNSYRLKWIFFRYLSKYSLENADHTIVTNKYLKLLIRNQSRSSAVLPDKIPNLIPSKEFKLKSLEHELTALLICTFSDDEPYREVFAAFKYFPEICLEVTGNYDNALNQSEINDLPSNVKLLGFVSNHIYIDHLFNCDFTVILTNQEFTLNCGSYESLAAKKPMLLSDTKTIRSYFTFGATYTKLDSLDSIRAGIHSIKSELTLKEREIVDQLPLMKKTWENTFSATEYFLMKQ